MKYRKRNKFKIRFRLRKEKFNCSIVYTSNKQENSSTLKYTQSHWWYISNYIIYCKLRWYKEYILTTIGNSSPIYIDAYFSTLSSETFNGGAHNSFKKLLVLAINTSIDTTGFQIFIDFCHSKSCNAFSEYSMFNQVTSLCFGRFTINHHVRYIASGEQIYNYIKQNRTNRLRKRE